ncbi:MAG: ion transporter [Bacteroidales bacterium]|nr:ion transporter [Bacteroidales bacterium]
MEENQKRTTRALIVAIGRKIAKWFVRVSSRIMHWLTFNILLPRKWKRVPKEDIYKIIFKSDTPAGKKFDIWLLVAIVLNIVLLVVDSMISDNSTLTERIHRNSSWLWWTMKALEWIFTLAFTIEYYLRVYCLKKPWRYVFSFYGIIDFLSIFPAYLSLIFPATQALSVLRLLRLLRIFRILKIESFVEEGHILMDALKKSVVKILIFMLFVYITAVILGTMMYAVEGGRNEMMTSIPKGIYWAVVTLTTVGYGDITPVTPFGQFLSVIVMILGYSIIAVPTGIVAGETIESHKRHRKKARKIKKVLDPVTEDDDEEDIS